MSGIMEKLTAALEANTAVIEAQNDLIGKIIAKGGAAADDKPATTRGRKPKGDADTKGDDEGDASPVDADELESTLGKVKGWLKEFSDADDDPENDARAEKMSAALKTLGVAKVSAITKESDRVRVDEWADKMIKKGRLTPEPKKAAAGKKADEDEI